MRLTVGTGAAEWAPMPETKPVVVDFAAYKAVRDEIAHEDNLAGARLNWFPSSYESRDISGCGFLRG